MNPLDFVIADILYVADVAGFREEYDGASLTLIIFFPTTFSGLIAIGWEEVCFLS
jgi:hypothetical protein